MSSPAERLRALSEAAGYESLAEFARDAGVADGTMRQHINRNSIPKDAGALYVRRASKTGVSLEWLLTGRGKAPKGVEDNDRPAVTKRGRANAATVDIPELEVHAMAGQGADGQFEINEIDTSQAMVGQYSFPQPGFRQNFGSESAGVIIAEVAGDSMSPTLPPGTKVMVNLKHKWATPDGVYFLWDGLGLVIKRIQMVPNSSPPRVKIISDNPRYESYERNVDEIHINGRVIVGLTRL